MISKSILSNYVGSVVGMLISKGARFLAVILCIRILGDYSWGEIVATFAIFSFLGLAIDQGLTGASLLFHLNSRGADSRLLYLISAYRLSLACLIIATIFGIHHAFTPLSPLVLTYSFVLIPRALNVEWWFQRRQLFQFTTYIASIRMLVFLSLVAMFVRGDSGAMTVIWLELISEAAALIFSYSALKLNNTRTSADNVPDIRLFALLSYAAPFLLIGLLNNIQANLDVVLLKALFDPQTVAQYDMGNKISFFYFFLGVMIVQIIRPKLTILYRNGEFDKFHAIIRSASGYMVLFSAIFLIPSLYFSNELILLLYGRQEPLSIFVYKWAALWVGFGFIASLCSEILLSLGLRRRYIQAAIACGIANILANLVLLTLFSGYGAIFAKIIAEITFITACWYALPLPVRRGISGGVFFQFIVLGILMAIFLASLTTNHPWIWAALSIVAVIAMARYRNVFSRKNLEVFRNN
jgi:O-antigen/teichoic acid export membrane protein